MTNEEALKRIEELEKKVKSLENQKTSPGISGELLRIRKRCFEKYFGEKPEYRGGETRFGPKGKGYSDYDTLRESIMKLTGLLFKYAKGKPGLDTWLFTLIRTESDYELYEKICDSISSNIRAVIDEYIAEVEE